MDQEDLARLNLLRKRLGKRLKRAQEGEYVRSLLPVLRSSKVRGRRLNISQVAVAIRATLYMPARGDRIDWSSVPDAECFYWQRTEERDSQFCAALQKLASPDERVVVVWYPEAAGLLINTLDACRVAPSLLAIAPTVWVLPFESAEWLIEVAHFDHEVCFGPTVPPHGT